MQQANNVNKSIHGKNEYDEASSSGALEIPTKVTVYVIWSSWIYAANAKRDKCEKVDQRILIKSKQRM